MKNDSYHLCNTQQAIFSGPVAPPSADGASLVVILIYSSVWLKNRVKLRYYCEISSWNCLSCFLYLTKKLRTVSCNVTLNFSVKLLHKTWVSLKISSKPPRSIFCSWLISSLQRDEKKACLCLNWIISARKSETLVSPLISSCVHLNSQSRFI